MKFISVVGARPEFIQATPISRVLRQHHTEILVHTGQHYDYKMSQTFFDELRTPAPSYNLEVGSNSHAKQTAEILMGIENILIHEKPDWVLVRGDTNSTLAGALAASKLHLPLAHIEAGERSFDKRMPEEINRLVADRVSDVHFCVSQTAVRHLAAEGMTERVQHVGDVMLDAMRLNKTIALQRSRVLQDLDVHAGKYVLATAHRAANTDDDTRLRDIVAAFNACGETVVFAVHPRTRKKIEALGIAFAPNVKAIEPVGYFDMVTLEANARLIATDSGGVQREAYFLDKPCITLRDETEWLETVEVGWNVLVGAQTENILQAWRTFSPPIQKPPIFGDGYAAEKIVNRLAVSF